MQAIQQLGHSTNKINLNLSRCNCSNSREATRAAQSVLDQFYRIWQANCPNTRGVREKKWHARQDNGYQWRIAQVASLIYPRSIVIRNWTYLIRFVAYLSWPCRACGDSECLICKYELVHNSSQQGWALSLASCNKTVNNIENKNGDRGHPWEMPNACLCFSDFTPPNSLYSTAKRKIRR